MGKKKKQEKKLKKAGKITLQGAISKDCKTKCCNKYEKSPSKRCKRCPCFDLLKKVA